MLKPIGQNLNQYNTNKKEVSFSGKQLLPIAIKTARRSWDSEVSNALKKEKCFFTEMNEEDIDFAYLEREVVEPSSFGGEIIKNFLDRISGMTPNSLFSRTHFYMIEPDMPAGTITSARAYAQVKERVDDLEIEYLQSASEYDSTKKIKGAGMAIMYGIIRLAKEWKKSCVFLVSSQTAEKWYEKLGFIRASKKDFYLPSEEYDAFLKRLEKKLCAQKTEFIIETKPAELPSMSGFQHFNLEGDK